MDRLINKKPKITSDDDNEASVQEANNNLQEEVSNQHAEELRRLREENRRLQEEVSEKDEEKRRLQEESRRLQEKSRRLGEELRRLREEKEAASVLGVLSIGSNKSDGGGKVIPVLRCDGNDSSHTNPGNHKKCKAQKKELALFDFYAFVKELKGTEHDPKLEDETSRLLPFCRRQPSYCTEADLRTFVTAAAGDAVQVCNSLLNAIAFDGKPPPDLVVRQVASIFSNRPDHIVLFNRTSNAPVFCIEVKKPFDNEQRPFDKPTILCGQLYDQLRALKGMGNSCPIGAITTFNATYFTMLDSSLDWNQPHTIPSLKKILDRFDKTPLTPSPFNVTESASGCARGRFKATFVQDQNRNLIISKQSVDQNQLVSALVVLILHALEGAFKPPPVERFSIGQLVHVDTIRMSDSSYDWGTLHTAYQGCMKRCHANEDLYLMHCIGTGSTSTAYHAISKIGYDCVVKIYVQHFDEDKNKKSTREFKKDSSAHVSDEVKNYKKIYGKELENHVWNRQVNKMDCVIMPFFEPVPKSERADKQVLESIRQRLHLVAEQKMAFQDDDRSWRHVGRFEEKIFLFDLGDMTKCKSVDEAEKLAEEHLNELSVEAGI